MQTESTTANTTRRREDIDALADEIGMNERSYAQMFARSILPTAFGLVAGRRHVRGEAHEQAEREAGSSSTTS